MQSKSYKGYKETLENWENNEGKLLFKACPEIMHLNRIEGLCRKAADIDFDMSFDKICSQLFH